MSHRFRIPRWVATALCVGTVAAGAQAIRSIQCSINNYADGWVADCNSDADCSAKYNYHLCHDHGFTQYCGVGYEVRPYKMSKTGWIIVPTISGALVGAAIGGAADVGKTDEEKKADKAAGKPPAAVQGAAIGAGAGLAMGLLFSMVAKHASTDPSAPWWKRAQPISRTDVYPFRLRLGVAW